MQMGVLSTACALGRADVPTAGLDEERAMPLMVALTRVALALFATVYDLRTIVCFGALPLRVRLRLQIWCV
jgi:hypothetical protein